MKSCSVRPVDTCFSSSAVLILIARTTHLGRTWTTGRIGSCPPDPAAFQKPVIVQFQRSPFKISTYTEAMKGDRVTAVRPSSNNPIDAFRCRVIRNLKLIVSHVGSSARYLELERGQEPAGKAPVGLTSMSRFIITGNAISSGHWCA